MGELVQCSGALTASPASSSDGQFPSASLNIPFNLSPSSKPFNVGVGDSPLLINSSGAYVTIPGIGGSVGPVTRAQLLYGRVSAAMKFRLTYLNDATPYVSYVGGLFIVETDPNSPIVLFEVEGSGTIEYYAAGLQ